MEKKKILIHSIAFSPDGVSTAYLYNDLALRFKEEGFEVVVLTTTPHYNRVESEIEKQPLRPKFFGFFYLSDYNGINVIHVPQKKFKSAMLRMVGFVYWHILSFFLGLSMSRVSLIISPSPPLTIGFINIAVGRLKGAKVIYNVQEIYPDFLTNQGKLTFKPAIKLLEHLERFVYNHSDAVTTIDKVFYSTIVNRFEDRRKLHLIPNFVDTKIYSPVIIEKEFFDENFPPKPDVLKLMYAGNIGHAQDWEPLLYLAKRFKDKKVEFWVIGEGVMKTYLQEQVKLHDLANIHVVPYQQRNKMPSLIAYADLHFIFMSPKMDGQGFPSKVYTIMACAKPLLVSSGNCTPIYNFLQPLACAHLITENSLDEKCEALGSLMEKLLVEKESLRLMGLEGYEYIQKEYSKEKVTFKYVQLIQQLLK
ncbi:glycosyltransferase WbuB [Pelobium manganitolerans]|uniref:Glycosyltransferase WbuB n=1 Tax=Pelobium manganitolerans TaxID=1842495 RepID=A0A419SC76_9SPHI|nr:glycosyltransferase family 4 protein [Pelobium manganitolerans]RKD20431.1 glycosyltransferase WbuB [Pelobium manganitolerans]